MAKHERSTLLKCPTCRQPWPDDDAHALRAFGWLDPLPRRIRPSNFDGIIAVIHDRAYKRFLVLEAKGGSEPIDAGQAELLRALASVPGFDVRVLRGTPERMTKHAVTSDGLGAGVVVTAAEARDGIWRWFRDGARNDLGGEWFLDLDVDWPA